MNNDRFPLLRKILGALGLSAEVIDDIVERILDWLSDKDKSPGDAQNFPYQVRDDFLSRAELSFYLVLRSVVGDRAQICPKVALGDLFFAKTGDHRQNRISTNRIDRKHVDFLLCEPKTLRPLLGIELDDSSHAREERQKRDEFVDGVFAAAKLPLVRIPVKGGYSPSEIESLLKPSLENAVGSSRCDDRAVFSGATRTVSVPPADSLEETAQRAILKTEGKRSCPKCGAEMVLRTAKSGRSVGEQFWGCSNFPKCRSVLPLSS